MAICILCLEEKELNKEHAILNAIGGSLTLNCLCNYCNSQRIGKLIDESFLQQPIVQMYRHQYKLDSYNQSIPFPLSGLAFDEENKKYKISMHDEQLVYKDLNTSCDIEFDENNNIRKIIGHLTVDTKEDFFKSLERQLKNKEYYPEQIEKVKQDLLNKMDEAEVKSYQPLLKKEFVVDLDIICFELVKVAYELAWHIHGYAYLHDPVASQIRQMLFQMKKAQDLSGSCFIDFPLKEIFLKHTPNCHIVLFMQNICYVKLFDFQAVFTIASNQAFFLSEEQAKIFIFDFESRKHSVKTLLEFLTECS